MVPTSDNPVKKQWQDGIRLIREDAMGSLLAEALRSAAVNEENPKTDLERFFVLLTQMTVNGTILLRRAYTGRWNASATPTSLPFQHVLIPNISNDVQPC
jgi:hypothetical protein